MIRQPTSPEAALTWHTAKLAGDNPPISDGVAHCGWYKMRLRKGAPYVPVRIYLYQEIHPITGELEADEEMRITIDGVDTGDDPADHWSYLRAITKQEYDWLVNSYLVGRYADPREALDLSAAPTPPPQRGVKHA